MEVQRERANRFQRALAGLCALALGAVLLGVVVTQTTPRFARGGDDLHVTPLTNNSISANDLAQELVGGTFEPDCKGSRVTVCNVQFRALCNQDGFIDCQPPEETPFAHGGLFSGGSPSV